MQEKQPVTAETFHPVFKGNESDEIPGGGVSHINQYQYLSEESANELAVILTNAGEPCQIARDKSGNVVGHPITYAGGIVKDPDGHYVWNGLGAAASSPAVHFVFADGTISNAGLLAHYWINNPPNPGDHDIVALRRAKEDIAGDREIQKSKS